MRFMRGIFPLVLSLLALALPASAQVTHPLNGKIANTRTGEILGSAAPALVKALFPCSAITMLGEVHDNADHHRIRAELIRAHVAVNRESPANCGRGAFVLEHISADQTSGLERFRHFEVHARRPANASDFFRMVRWDSSGWPDKAIFYPLVSEIIRSRRAISGGNPSATWVSRLAKEGVSAIPPERARELGLDVPLGDKLEDALLSDLEASHCGLVPKSAFGKMALAQRYRDAYMAEAVLKAARAQGSAVLLAGNEHVRLDRGVPAALRRTAPDRTVITVAFVETEDGRNDPATYGPRDPQGRPATDYVAFAAPAQREDPCEGMRKAMKK